MTIARTAGTAQSTSNAVFTADEAVRQARRTVEELHETVTSALGVLRDAEFDSAKSRLSDRSEIYLENAASHLGRLQNRCTAMRELSADLGSHLDRAGAAIDHAQLLAGDVGRSTDPAATPGDAAITQDATYLRQQLAVLGEMVDVARPLAQLATSHVEKATEASQNVTAASLLEPHGVENAIRSAGQELGRADEDINVLEKVVDRAHRTSTRSMDMASDLNEAAQQRLTSRRNDPVPGGTTNPPGHHSPAR